MKYRLLGRTGLKVSRVCLGALNFGQKDWGCSENDSVEIMHAFFDKGGNFVDTADFYSRGISEEIVGKGIKNRRQNIILATKFFNRMGDGINDKGGSRKHIFNAVEASLRRLRTDYIDLYQIHFWDKIVPIEETMYALNDLVRQGKVRYIGCSNFQAWQLTKSLWISDKNNLARFDCLQPQYSLCVRDIERELLPLCADQNIAVIPWSPLANGILAGKHSYDNKPLEKTRIGRAEFIVNMYWKKRYFEIADAVVKIAKECEENKSPAQLALAWLLHDKVITSVIIGAKRMSQFEENMVIGDWDIPEDIYKQLDDVSRIEYGYPNDFIERVNSIINADFE